MTAEAAEKMERKNKKFFQKNKTKQSRPESYYHKQKNTEVFIMKKNTWTNRFACLMLGITLLLSLCACGTGEPSTELPILPAGQTAGEQTEKPATAPITVPAASEMPAEPTEEVTEEATEVPTEEPSEDPVEVPTEDPAEDPVEVPTEEPSEDPSEVPTEKPVQVPTEEPTEDPTAEPDTESDTETDDTFNDMVAPGDPGDIGHGGAPETNHSHVYTAVAIKNPTCTSQGYTVYTCYCGDMYFGDHTDPAGHDYTVTVVPPTEDAEGYTEYTCGRCGDHYRENE